MTRFLLCLSLGLVLFGCSKGQVAEDDGTPNIAFPTAGTSATDVEFGNSGTGGTVGGASGSGAGPLGQGGSSAGTGLSEGCTAQELCGDRVDNDCDALAEEGCACEEGTEQPCYEGSAEHAGVGACDMGRQRCSDRAELRTWEACSGSKLPVDEECDDELDNDCDGRADEGCVCTPGDTRDCYGASDETIDVGACREGTLHCEEQDGEGLWGDDCEDEVTPETELCGNDVDENCDGELDDGCACDEGDTEPCYTGTAATREVGECEDGVVTCEVDDGVAEWTKDCEGEVTPAAELCGDELDSDCDGEPDNGCVCVRDQTEACYTGTAQTRGVGACHDGVVTCEISEGEAAWGVDCDGAQTPDDELCGNEIDEDCDGNLDNGCICQAGETDDCYPGTTETRGVGACEDGELHCEVEGGVARWGTDCEGAVTPETEICDNDVDEDCDGSLVNGCASIECPEDMTVPAGEPVQLTVVGDQVDDYVFEIIDAPDGGASTAIWTGLDPSQPSADLTTYIVGEYTIRVSAQDADGEDYSCTFDLTAQPHGLRVQLAWDGTGDVDLHLHNNGATPWFSPPDDCYFSNRMPAWGAVLDFDNIPGPGPENITIDFPVVGTTYTIGVHHYSMATGRIATVDVFCGDTSSTPQQTYVSHPLEGTATGSCSANDFWRVARVTFTSTSACTIETIDQYVPSATACTTL